MEELVVLDIASSQTWLLFKTHTKNNDKKNNVFTHIIMSSTRNKNTQGDYFLEQARFHDHLSYNQYQGHGVNDTTYLPDQGLLAGKLHGSLLSHNNHDIESYLYGIGSTNLVSLAPHEITPQLKTLKHLSVSDKLYFVMPEPLVVKKHERPCFH